MNWADEVENASEDAYATQEQIRKAGSIAPGPLSSTKEPKPPPQQQQQQQQKQQQHHQQPPQQQQQHASLRSRTASHDSHSSGPSGAERWKNYSQKQQQHHQQQQQRYLQENTAGGGGGSWRDAGPNRGFQGNQQQLRQGGGGNYDQRGGFNQRGYGPGPAGGNQPQGQQQPPPPQQQFQRGRNDYMDNNRGGPGGGAGGGGSWRDSVNPNRRQDSMNFRRHDSFSSAGGSIGGASGSGGPPPAAPRDQQYRTADYNRRDGGRPGHQAPPQHVQHRVSYGVVTNLKEKFGFMQAVSEELKSDVFFHFDQISKNDCDPSKLTVGDEIEFEMNFGKGNRVSATKMKLLPRGTIEYDKKIEGKESLYGIVLNETFRPHHMTPGGHSSRRGPSQFDHQYQSGGNEFLESKFNNRYFQGHILALTKAELDELIAQNKFLPDGIDINASIPADGEKVVSFGSRGVLPLIKARELLKASGEYDGPIDDNDDDNNNNDGDDNDNDDDNKSKASDRRSVSSASVKKEAMTSTSPAGKVIHPSRGDIVKFDLGRELATGRKHAINIAILKDGKTRMQEIIDQIIQKEGLKKERGRVSALSQLNTWNAMAVGLLECEERGDKVYFFYRDLPEKFHPRYHKKLMQEKAAARREQDRKRFDWRQAAEEDSDLEKLRVGVELEFYVINDPLKPTRMLAIKLEALPFGTVQFEQCLATSTRGVLTSLDRQGADNDDTFRNDDSLRNVSGKIKLKKPLSSIKKEEGETNAEQGQEPEQLEVDFAGEDFVSPGPRLRVGDIVELEVHKIRRTGKLLGRGIQLVQPVEEAERVEASPLDVWKGKTIRETGIVSNVRDKFGFIDCLDRFGLVFFPLKEVISQRHVDSHHHHHNNKGRRSMRDEVIREGDFVSFEVAIDGGNKDSSSITKGGSGTRSMLAIDKRTVAIRVMKIGPSCKEIPVETKWVGVVSKLPPKYDSRGKHGKRGGKDSNNRENDQQRANMDGFIKAKPCPTLAPDIYQLLEKFANDQLYVDEGSKTLVTSIEVLSDTTYSMRSGKGQSHRGGSSVQGDSKKTESATKTEHLYTLNVEPNLERVVRDYCGWFGLKSEARANDDDDLPNAVIVRKRTEKEKDKKDGPRELEMSVSFLQSSVAERRAVHIGDKVEFKLSFDKRSYRHAAHGIKILEQAKRKPVPVKRRPNTEVGIISHLHEQGFGFIVSADRPDRLFFHVADCDGNYRNSIKAGDEVEYKYSSSSKGAKATSLRFLPRGTIVVDEPVLDEETKKPKVLRGFIIREPKSVRSASGPSSKQGSNKEDHPYSLWISQIHAPGHTFGRLIDNQAAMKQREAKTKTDKSWRRAGELQNMLRRFRDADNGNVWEVDDDLPESEKKDLASSAKRLKMVLYWDKGNNNRLIIARNAKELSKYKKSKKPKKEKKTEGKEDGGDDDDEEGEGENNNKEEEIGQGDEEGDIEEDDDDEEDDEDESEATDTDDDDSKKNGDEGSTAADSKSGNGAGAPSSEKDKEQESGRYTFTLFDCKLPKEADGEETSVLMAKEGSSNIWNPMVGDEVEFELCINKANNKLRATNIRLVNSGSKPSRGIIEGAMVSGRPGFVRPLNPGEGSAGLYGNSRDVVDESFKPGGGGRDGTIRFDRKDIQDGIILCDGDEVEYTLVINSRTKEAKATRIKLIKRAMMEEPRTIAAPPKVKIDALKQASGATSAISVQQKFHTAKGPDGTNGFPAGRGRNLPLRTKLRVTAKEFRPGF